MKIKSAPGFVQPLLFDVPQDKEFGTNGAARTHYGNTVQALVCDLLGLVLREIVGPTSPGSERDLGPRREVNGFPRGLARIVEA